MDGAEQCAAEDAGHAHHVEGVQGPVVEALEEQQEAEDRCHAERRSKEPAALAEGVHQEDADEHRNRAGEGDGVVRTNAHQTGNFELTQHEADQAERTVQCNEGPEATELGTNARSRHFRPHSSRRLWPMESAGVETAVRKLQPSR